jgi:hypothetical protein
VITKIPPGPFYSSQLDLNEKAFNSLLMLYKLLEDLQVFAYGSLLGSKETYTTYEQDEAFVLRHLYSETNPIFEEEDLDVVE